MMANRHIIFMPTDAILVLAAATEDEKLAAIPASPDESIGRNLLERITENKPPPDHSLLAFFVIIHRGHIRLGFSSPT